MPAVNPHVICRLCKIGGKGMGCGCFDKGGFLMHSIVISAVYFWIQMYLSMHQKAPILHGF
jgi:hypothetical protein